MSRIFLFVCGMLGCCIGLYLLYVNGMPVWIIGICLALLLLLSIPVIYLYLLVCSPLDKLLYRRRLRKLERSIANDQPALQPYPCMLGPLWNHIHAMKPGRKRKKFQDDLLLLVQSALQTNDYFDNPEMDSFRWYFSDCFDGLGCYSENCPQCGKPVHIVLTNAMYNEKVFAVNEDEKNVLTWLEPKDKPDPLPNNYHTDECPHCGNRHFDNLFAPESTIPFFRFLQDFTLILPDGKRISFADDKGKEKL